MAGISGIGGRPQGLRMPEELPGLSSGAKGSAGVSQGKDATGGAGFGDTMKEFLGEVNDMQLRSDSMLQSFVRGETQDLHRVVLAQQEAAISLRLVTEMRDRLLNAYQEVMRMSM